MTDILTRLCLVGAAVLFAAWLVLRYRGCFARATDALAKVSRARLAAFLAFVAIATVCAQKPGGTNEPPQGAGNPLHLLHFYTANPPGPLFRLESESTNGTYSYAMPSNGVRYSNWWIRGAYEDVFRLDLGGLLFPLGTNLCDSLWVYTWGMAGARLGDASNRIVAAGVPMSAVPGLSQFWSAETDGGGRLLTWQDFALNRDTNTPVSAQLELMPSGDFIARSNLVERLYRRVNPDDWDDDGIPNDTDPNPLAYDGDNFGPHQELPEGANTNHYYWVDVVVSQANARVTFEGDGYSHLPDPEFIARAGDTNRVVLLLGKPYEIHCNMPVRIVGKEGVEVEVLETDGNLGVVWPVSLEFVPLAPMRSSGLRSHGAFGGTTIAVHPERASGGGFGWTGGFCCYYLTAGGTPVFDCDGNCGCRGCFTGDITYVIGGFMMTFDGLQCPCEGGSGDDSAGEGDGYGEDDGPYVGGASATFSKSAVIFEDGYWNTPGVWVERQSTVTELNCVAHGGPNGGHVRFEVSAGAGKLERVSGRVLPVEQDVEAGKKLDFTVGYKGQLPSGEANDIVVTTTFTENVPNAEPVSSRAKVTSVKVELEAVYVAPENTNQHRHVYGVGERVRLKHIPVGVTLSWSLGEDDFFSDILDGEGCDKILQLHYLGGANSDVVANCKGESYHPPVFLIEPQAVVCNHQVWNNECSPKGHAGGFGMRLSLYISPMYVSFQGIDVSEIPCETVLQPTGYYATTNFDGVLVHNFDAEAGYWHHVSAGNYWCIDDAKSNVRRQVWSNGTMTWNIPIQWYQRLDATESWTRGTVHSDGKLIGGSEDAYQQVFEITESGTVKVTKHQHWIERTTNDVIRLDGATVHEGNH